MGAKTKLNIFEHKFLFQKIIFLAHLQKTVFIIGNKSSTKYA
jgi:hypothetical protein